MDYIAVDTVFRPLYLYSRFFGCNLFQLPKSSKTVHVSVKWIDVLIFLIYVGIYAGMFLTLVYSQSESNQILRNLMFHLTAKTGSLIMEILGRVLFNTFAATNIFISLMDLANRDKIWNLLCELNDFDNKMKKLGVFTNRYITRKLVIRFMVVTATLYLSNMFVSVSIYKYLKLGDIYTPLRFYAGAQASDGCFTLLLTIFIFFLYNILERFRKINKIVIQCYSLNDDIAELQYPQGYNLKIRDMASLYLQLSSALKIASDAYSIQVMFAVLVTYCFGLVSVYVIYKIATSFDMFMLIGSFVYITRAIFFNFYFFVIIHLSTAISTESKQIASLINKAINKSGNDASTHQLEQFSHQVSHCSNQLTCGLFTFDWNIVYVICGASLTYLTLFIQFDLQIQNAILLNWNSLEG